MTEGEPRHRSRKPRRVMGGVLLTIGLSMGLHGATTVAKETPPGSTGKTPDSPQAKIARAEAAAGVLSIVVGAGLLAGGREHRRPERRTPPNH